METESRLIRFCIESACSSRESIERWRRQRRTLDRMPSHLAEALIQRLLQRRLLFPSLLEIFKNCAEEVDLSGEVSVDAEWMAYLGGFRYLSCLKVASCHKVTSSAVWPITGMSNLKELDFSRCMKLTDSGVKHLLSISTLEKLRIAETGLTSDGISLLASLSNLSLLDLGGLPVTDSSLQSLQVLKKLQYLDLWGSKISDEGVVILKTLPKLSFLNLAWTKVTMLPNLSSLKCLNMSNCTIASVLVDNGSKAPLCKLLIAGATLVDEAEVFNHIESNCLSFLNVMGAYLHGFYFLSNMNAMEHLDLSSIGIDDNSVDLIAHMGENLRYLNLSNTKVTSAGVKTLVGCVPKLEILSLSHTAIDDTAIPLISTMSSLKDIDLSHTNIEVQLFEITSSVKPLGGAATLCVWLAGFTVVTSADAEPSQRHSLASLESITIEKLNIEQTLLRDDMLYPVSKLQELRQLFLQGSSLTDMSLHQLSSLPRLQVLGFRDAVLTTHGLESFESPITLGVLDLRGCWLLTEAALALFSREHPQIELRHELVQILPSRRDSSSPLRTLKTLHGTRNTGKISTSPSYVDQRLKYNREELLALQNAPLSIKPRDWQDEMSSMQ